MLRIRKFGEMPCGYDGAAMEFSFSLPRLRHNGISPRLCRRPNPDVRDSLLFNRLMHSSEIKIPMRGKDVTSTESSWTAGARSAETAEGRVAAQKR